MADPLMGSLRPMQKRARYTKWREPEYRVYLVGYGCERKKNVERKEEKRKKAKTASSEEGKRGD